MKGIADIVQRKKPKRRYVNKWLSIAAAISTFGFLLAWLMSGERPPHIDNVRLAKVERGDLAVQVYGYGRLQSKYQRLLTSEARGVVEQVLLKPGAVVTPDSVILVLSAPELLERLADAELEFARVKADYDTQKLEQQNNLLAQEATIAQLQTDYELASLKVEAETELVHQGIVSELDYQESKLTVRQLHTRVEIANQRRDTMTQMAKQQMQIHADLLARYEERLRSLRQRVERLNVRAGLHGVVQALAVEIGQSVPQGSELATVGSTSQLIAELRVAQDEADRVIPGHTVNILTQGAEVAGQVIRLDPIVTDGRVIVEVDLTGKLPANARPDLTVEGRIQVAYLENVLILEAPTNIAAFSSRQVFKLHPDQNFAQESQMKFGNLSGGQVEVLDGAAEGEQVVISDTSQWLGTERITLTL